MPVVVKKPGRRRKKDKTDNSIKVKEEPFVIKRDPISPVRVKSTGSSDGSILTSTPMRTIPSDITPQSTMLAAGMHEYVPINSNVKTALQKRLSGQDVTPQGVASLNHPNGAPSLVGASQGTKSVTISQMVLESSRPGLVQRVPTSSNSTTAEKGMVLQSGSTSHIGKSTSNTTGFVELASMVSNNKGKDTIQSSSNIGGSKTDNRLIASSSTGNLLSVITSIGQPVHTQSASTASLSLSQSAATGLSAAQARQMSMLSQHQGLYNFVNPNNQIGSTGGLLETNLSASDAPLSPQNVTLYPSAANDSVTNSTVTPPTTSQSNSKVGVQPSTIYMGRQDNKQVYVATTRPDSAKSLQTSEAANVLVSISRTSHTTHTTASIKSTQRKTVTTSAEKPKRGRKRGSTNSNLSHHIPPAKVPVPSSREMNPSSLGTQESIISMVTNVNQPLGISAIPSPDAKGTSSSEGARAAAARRVGEQPRKAEEQKSRR